MKLIRKFFLIFISLLYFDLIFNIFAYDKYTLDGIINILLFDLVNTFIIFILTSLFNNKINRNINYLLYLFLGFWYSFFYIFYKVFITPFSIALFRQSDQTLKFGKNIIISILQNIHIIILFMLPLILFIVFRKKVNYNKINFKSGIKLFLVFVIVIVLFISNLFFTSRGTGSIYNLVFETNNVSLNIEKLGVMGATFLDVERCLFGFDEKIIVVDNDDNNDLDEVVEYDYNTLELEFPDNDSVRGINDFVIGDLGTKKNKYTGIFKDKNLIFIVAESFSEIAVSEELTPTLYKLIHEGFYFSNFYTSNNLSTIGGEFQALTGLYADNSILSSWRGGNAKYPYGIGTVFGNLDYKVSGYHNNSAYYQDRNIYLKSQGISNYLGCYNGLEKRINCNSWPQSDIEMIRETIDDYINSDKFMTYYMTVSGHFYYGKSDNSIVTKNYSLVENLNYPAEVKGYLATQIELDRALNLLIEKLEENNKLDDTVIVLVADHFPYALGIDNINVLSDYKRDLLIEANSNNLIIYNSQINHEEISKVSMSIDVLPTVLNLFGIEYDSRIIMGKDIFSDTLGVAIFKDKSWVTNEGTYYASTGEFKSNGNDVSLEYIDNVNAIVNNRVAISRMIVINDYYRKLFK